ncbi:MAG: DUF2357 domain-containing protein [Gemmatimonadetes bacterium]|nr:DUF2357 domain-containing protein [Gemmatimonadota bacterium]MYG22665.1 DUF2357 domain-containing protein [Gemmatimonadota bacterium]MYJ39134.1 DUF2357 domain-containing protein [Gemmatimonadota bacterium]
MNGSAEIERTSRVIVHAYRSRESAEKTDHGYRLQSERRWVVEGDDQALTQIANQLPKANRTWLGKQRNALILNLVNSVGTLELPHLGTLDLVSRKFDEDQFDAMLRDLTESATTLPFSANEAAAGRYSVSTVPRDEVLYHAFVYLRYILSDRAPEEVRLLPALEMIVREPHRLWRSHRRDVRIEAMTRVDAHTPLDLVTRPGMSVVGSSLSPSGARLAERLRWRLPEFVSERKIRSTTDTAENRFVKAFIGQARTIIGRMRSAVSSPEPDAFRRNLLRDCDRMESSLMPIARHSMWEEVGRMVRIPFSSTVLQRRQGYRRVLQHFSRIRLDPTIPLDRDGMRDLLELKNIALLYELWTFFRVVDEISAVLGRPPVRSGRLATGPFQTAFPAGGTYEWDPGVRLVYNQRFSRSWKRQRHSYSVPLIPDIALRVPDGPKARLHLFDAKFRVQALTDVGFAADDKDADDDKIRERAGSFKRADIYKMHAYRDAIPEARSVWVLYPGGEFRFFGIPGRGVPVGHPAVSSPEELPEKLMGVGAIPLVPVVGVGDGHGPGTAAANSGVLRATLERMLQQ